MTSLLQSVPRETWVIAGSAGAIVFIVALASAARPGSRARARTFRARELVHAASRKAMASDLAADPLIKVQEANYARAYLHAARLLVSDEDIELAAGVRVDDLARVIEGIEKKAATGLTDACPGLKRLDLVKENKNK